MPTASPSSGATPFHGLSVRSCAASLCIAMVAMPFAVRAYTLGIGDSMTKYRSDLPAPALPGVATIKAAKNEFEAFQIVLTGPIRNVLVQASDLTGPGTIAAAGNVTLYREDYIHVTAGSSGNPESVPGWWPDPLVPAIDEVYGEGRNAFPFDVPSSSIDPTHQTRAVWVDVFVPPAAAAGDYTGQVTVSFVDGNTNANVTVPVAVNLHVWNFGLPSTPTLKSQFRLLFPDLACGHGVSPPWPALQAAYTQLALDHRVTIATTDDGGSGTAADAFSNYGDLIQGTTPPLPRKPRRLQDAHLTWVYLMGNTTTAGVHEWWSTFVNHGLQDRLSDNVCDEPENKKPNETWSDCVARANLARAESTDLHVSLTADWTEAHGSLATAAGFQVGTSSSPGMVDTFIPLIDHLWAASGPYAGNPTPPPYGRSGDYADWIAQKPGMRSVIDYQSCDSTGCGGTLASGWPNYTIDARSTQNRASPWLSFELGTSGEFYYDMTYTYHPAVSAGDPWSAPVAFGAAGEGTLFYPGVTNTAGRVRPAGLCSTGGFAPSTPSISGTHDVPIGSLRLKLIREGIEDYEYLTLYKAAGGNAVAKALAVFPNAFTTDADPALLMQTRTELAQGIEAAQSSFQIVIVTDPVSGARVPIVLSF